MLYIDDLLIAFSSDKTIESINLQFSSHFKMEDCGKSSVCLGIEIHKDPSTRILFIIQERYGKKVLVSFGMLY